MNLKPVKFGFCDFFGLKAWVFSNHFAAVYLHIVCVLMCSSGAGIRKTFQSCTVVSSVIVASHVSFISVTCLIVRECCLARIGKSSVLALLQSGTHCCHITVDLPTFSALLGILTSKAQLSQEVERCGD